MKITACRRHEMQYESDFMSAIIRTMMHFTPIEWVSSHSDAYSDALDSQVGFIEINSLSPSEMAVSHEKAERISETEYCIGISCRITLSVTLSVVNSIMTDAKGEKTTINPSDIFIRLRESVAVNSHFDGERSQIMFTSFGDVDNGYEQTGSNVTRRISTMKVRICINRKSSFIDNALQGFCIETHEIRSND